MVKRMPGVVINKFTGLFLRYFHKTARRRNRHQSISWEISQDELGIEMKKEIITEFILPAAGLILALFGWGMLYTYLEVLLK